MADNDLIRRGDAKAICGTIIRNDEAARIEGFLATLPAAQVTVTPLEWVTSDHFPSVSVAWCPLFEKNFYAEEPGDKEKVDAKRAARIRSVLTVTPRDPAKMQALVEALRSTLNFIQNTESEMGVILGCGDKARAALAAWKATK